VDAHILGLQNGTTYYFSALAENELGYDLQEIAATPRAVPTVLTLTASNFTSSSVTLVGQVNPNSLNVDVDFVWGTDGLLFPNIAPAEPATLNGSDLTTVRSVLDNLPPGQTIYYQARASAGSFPVNGDRSAVSTLGAPEIITIKADEIKASSANISAEVNAHSRTTAVFVEYGTARALALQLGLANVANILATTLQEKKDTDAKLTELAETEVNEPTDGRRGR